MLTNYLSVLWDFDGVILDSMAIRDQGFRDIFKEHEQNQVDRLIHYHRRNGGLSRYIKIRYFYEKILQKKISDEQVIELAAKFSKIMRNHLVNPKNLILDSLNFIEQQYLNYNFHIVSGSDQEELRYLCSELNIDKYFKSIHGSPMPKKNIVANLMEKHNYKQSFTCLIGDSINDYEASKANKISFFGYNNIELKKFKNSNYIDQFY